MTAASLSPTSADEIDRTYRKVAWRIIPLLMVCYVLAFIDRGNVGFAKLQFMGDLGFNEAVYGLGGGLFYLGYSLFEVPSNLLLARVGVRLTLLRIMVIWGMCSAALAFMTAPSHYYILRTLLGAAEAGFFPGILYYITTWIPASRRGRFTAYFMSAIAISGILSGPLSGLIMHTLDGVLGLKGWQWLFLVEGLPSAAMGVVAYYALPDSPRSARWLTPLEMTIITTELEGEQKAKQGHGAESFREALADKRLYVILGMSVGLLACGAGIPLWLPTILRKAGVTDVFELGLMAAVPSIVGVMVQQLNARHSDHTQERRWHAAIPALFCALGWLLLPFTMDNAWLSLAILSMMMAGFLGATGPYWTLPALYLSGPAAAGGIAMITTIGGLGAFFVPTLVGWLTAETGSLSAGLVFYGVVMTVGVAIMLAGTRAQPKRLVPASA